MNNNNLKVSVAMITYNHAQYIKEAIEGVMKQNVNFNFELIISDDNSTDGTQTLYIDLRNKYPNNIKLLLNSENMGMSPNFVNVLKSCSGKYIALCEGDDYWTDPYKLQKQVDFLEKYQEYDICSHQFRIYDSEKGRWYDEFSHPKMNHDEVEGVEFDFNTNIKEWHSQTLTLLFRRERLVDFEIEKYSRFCDYHLCYLYTKEKKGFCMNFTGAVYRLHGGGVFSKVGLENRTIMGYYTVRDLFEYNKDDTELAKNYYRNRNAFFENYLRLSIYKRNFSKKYAKELWTYLLEEYNNNGIKSVLYSLKKFALSYIKSFKRKNS